MIVIYYPRYVKKDYCCREFRGMQLLEKKRFDLLGEDMQDYGMIIPIILQGKEKLPVEIKDCRHYCDLTMPRHATIDDFKSDKRTIEELMCIAEYINDLYDIVRRSKKDIFKDCGSFRLPRKVEPLGELGIRDPYAGKWGPF